MLIRMARELQQGKEPYAATHGDVYRIRPLDVLDRAGEFNEMLMRYQEEALSKR